MPEQENIPLGVNMNKFKLAYKNLIAALLLSLVILAVVCITSIPFGGLSVADLTLDMIITTYMKCLFPPVVIFVVCGTMMDVNHLKLFWGN